MNNKELNNIMFRIQNGDEDSFRLFYNETHRGFFSFIYSYIKNYHISQDLLQETYIKVKFKADKYNVGTNAVAWVLQIAKNTCLDYLRKEESKPVCELNEDVIADKNNIVGNLYFHNLLNMHIHEGGSCTGNASDPLADAGMHYNPNKCPHPEHAGDLPSLFTTKGNAFLAVLTDRFSINEIIGKTVIIHSAPDDFGTQPAGNSRSKIACGEIRVYN